MPRKPASTQTKYIVTISLKASKKLTKKAVRQFLEAVLVDEFVDQGPFLTARVRTVDFD